MQRNLVPVEIVNYLELVVHTDSDSYQVLLCFPGKGKVSQDSCGHILETVVLMHSDLCNRTAVWRLEESLGLAAKRLLD